MSSNLFANAFSTALRISLMLAMGSNMVFAQRGAPIAAIAEPSSRGEENKERAQLPAANRIENRLPSYRVEGQGPLLIYIAGLDGTGELFFKQTPALATSYRVVTFRSRESGRFTYDDLADDVAAIIRDLGEQRATIVAESFGGGVGFTFALRYPSMVERLVIVNSFARFRAQAKIRLAIIFNSVLPPFLTSSVRRMANTVGLRADGVLPEDRERFFKAQRTVARAGYARRLHLIAHLDVESRLSEIQTPTLFIAGAKDMLVPSVKEAHRMAARIPNAKIKIISGAGHACLLGNRVRLADILAQ
jgi:3-oxoadipate enol-lactonase